MESLAEVRRVQAPKSDKRPDPPKVVAVASGKGGVGKTLIGFGMAWYLARIGYRVAVVDLDFGVGNLHLSAGLGRVESSLDDFFSGKTDDLNELRAPLEDNPKVSILAAGGRRSSATRIREDQKRAFLEQLPALDADLVFLDLGAGSSQDNINFFLRAEYQIAVATADLSAMTALIAFLKKALIHHVIKYAGAVYPGSSVLAASEYARISDVYNAIDRHLGEDSSRSLVRAALETFRPAVLLNRVGQDDLVQVARVSKNLMRQLNSTATVLGTLPEDEAITRCRRLGQNCFQSAPESDLAKALAATTSRWQERHCLDATEN